jgi:hypothetical protein
LWAPNGETTQSITATSAGNYTVTVTNGNGCSATSAATTVTINPLPTPPTITINGNTLQSSAATGNQWYIVGNPNSVGNGQTHNPAQDGNYFIVYTDGNGCTATSDTVFIDITGITEDFAKQGIAIYPNPATDNVTIAINANKAGAVYAVYDQLGRNVLSGKLTDENTTVNLNGLAPGMYMLTINGNLRATYKLLKQ